MRSAPTRCVLSSFGMVICRAGSSALRPQDAQERCGADRWPYGRAWCRRTVPHCRLPPPQALGAILQGVLLSAVGDSGRVRWPYLSARTEAETVVLNPVREPVALTMRVLPASAEVSRYVFAVAPGILTPDRYH